MPQPHLQDFKNVQHSIGELKELVTEQTARCRALERRDVP